jgi:hypothetical protein
LQDRFNAVLKVLEGLKLGTLTRERALEAGSPENAILRGFMHLINDHRLQLRLAPTSPAVAHIPQLVQAAASAPAATQAGMAAYALLSPVADALENLQLLARGNETHMEHVAVLKGHVLERAGRELWKQALQTTQRSNGVDTRHSQDVFSNTWLNWPRLIRFSGLNSRKCRAHFMISLMKSAG